MSKTTAALDLAGADGLISIGGTHTLKLGIDIGSTTVKAVLLAGRQVIFSDYRRHHADVRRELAGLLRDINSAHPGITVKAAVTGSGGLSVAGAMKVPFVQEVIAGTKAVGDTHPQTDVIIELGGEDAKITYLHPTPEQRMNGTCAGGTGAFIDQMATLLHTDASGLDKLAARANQLYPIASRCGVFAKLTCNLCLTRARHTKISRPRFLLQSPPKLLPDWPADARFAET